ARPWTPPANRTRRPARSCAWSSRKSSTACRPSTARSWSCGWPATRSPRSPGRLAAPSAPWSASCRRRAATCARFSTRTHGMGQRTAPPELGALDGFVRAFEAAQPTPPPPSLDGFLPAPVHPLYADAVRELVRVEIEFGWERGAPRPLRTYLERFPDVFSEPGALTEIAFEEYRQ